MWEVARLCACVNEYHKDGEGPGFRELSCLSLDTQRRQVTDVHGTLLMTSTDRLGGDTGTPVVSQRSEGGEGILEIKSGRGKYDMWYDWVVKEIVFVYYESSNR